MFCSADRRYGVVCTALRATKHHGRPGSDCFPEADRAQGLRVTNALHKGKGSLPEFLLHKNWQVYADRAM